MWFKLNTNKQIVIKSSTVVTLPNVDTLIVLSLLRTNREPKITKRSLIIIPQKNIFMNKGLSQNINKINTVLSAKGSIIVPKFVTALYFLARNPSRESDSPIKDIIIIKTYGLKKE